MQRYLKHRYKPWVGANWLFRRKGPGATKYFEGGGFVRSNEDVRYPNLMFHFLPIAVRYDGSSPDGGEGYQVHVGPMYSDAIGSVKITSTDPKKHPALRLDAETALHPSCSLRMGVDEMSVVDPLTMGVHGLAGLKVVDASVMPYVTNGNIYAPVMMLAEKAADLILGKPPLPRAEVDFFRHQVAEASMS